MQETKFTLTELEGLIKHQLKLFNSHAIEEDPILIKLNTVAEMTCLSEGIVLSKMKKGEFPKPVKVHKMRLAWKKRDVINWIKELPYVQDRLKRR